MGVQGAYTARNDTTASGAGRWREGFDVEFEKLQTEIGDPVQAYTQTLKSISHRPV